MKILRLVLKIILIMILIDIIVIRGYFVYLKSNTQNKQQNETTVVDKIDTFDYVLANNKNELYKTYFSELKKVLKSEEVNEENYAKALSKLFVADFYTLANKVSSSDIGGREFVYTSFAKDFISIAKTTIYKSIKSNLYGERVQELPTVTNVLVEEVNKTDFKYQDKEFKDAIVVKIKIEYEKDLSYPVSCELTLVKNEKKLEIVKLV